MHEHTGWKTRNRTAATGKAFGPVIGVLIHHTGGRNDKELCYRGRADLPGSGRTPATPELAFVLLRLAENIVLPVTGALGDGEPHTDFFALDKVGCILLSALRDWTQGPRRHGRMAEPASRCRTSGGLHRRHPREDPRRRGGEQAHLRGPGGHG